MIDLDARADPALVRVLDGNGELRGTAFAIAPNALLTCDHVAAMADAIRLQTVDGADLGGPSSVVRWPELDLALLSFVGERNPLAVAPRAGAAGRTYWAKGFHRTGASITAAFPLQGSIIGTTDVSYSTAEHDYEIHGALVLRNDEIAEALSGAPVLDPETGAVVAVVNARLEGRSPGGFAVPISVQAAPAALRDLLAENARTVPLFGGHLNPAGGATAAREQVAAAIEQMQLVQGVDLQRRVPRTALAGQLAAAMADDRCRLVVVIGGSGVGKSTELAACARASSRPAVLVRGVTVPRDSRGVGDELARALGTRLAGADSAAMAASVRSLGGLLVVVDGLNESELSGQRLDEWLATSIGWLTANQAHMLVSTRPEYWSQAEPLIERLRAGPLAELTLDVFSPDEQVAAAASYGVELGSGMQLLRRPISMRLYAEVVHRRTAGGAVSVSSASVVEAYVRDVARRVAGRLGSPFSADAVVDWITELGARQLSTEAGVIDARTFGEVVPAALGAGELLRQETLVARVATGYRFTYDEVGDWVAGQELDVASELDPGRAAMPGPMWRRVGPVISALLVAEDRDGVAEVRNLLTPIVDRIPVMSRPSAFVGGPVDQFRVQVLEGFLARADDARPYLELLRSYARTWTEVGSPIGGRPGYWVALRLPAAQRLALLRDLVVHDNYWGWRVKDWLRGDGPPMGSYGSAALEIAAPLETEVLGELANWLSDARSLVDGEATVADVAMGIVYRHRLANPAGVWRWLADNADGADALRQTLAGEHTAWFVDTLLTHARPETDASAVAGSLSRVRVAHLSAAALEALVDFARDCIPRLTLPAAVLTARVFVATNTADAEGLIDLARLFREGRQPSLAWHLAGQVDQHRQLVADTFTAVLAAGGPSAGEALAALDGVADGSFCDEMDAVVTSGVEAGVLPIDVRLTMYVESRLSKVDRVTPTLGTLVELVVRRAGSTSLSPVAFGLATLPERDLADAVELIRLLVDHPGEYHGVLLAGLLRTSRTSNIARSIAVEVLLALDVDRRDHVCFAHLLAHEAGDEQLVDWYLDETIGTPGERMAAVSDAVGRGASVDAAVSEVVQKLIR